jgi:uncharacterized membrane protein
VQTSRTNIALWIIPLLYFLFILIVFSIDVLSKGAIAAITVLILSIFGVIHARQRYSAKELLVYIAIGFVASNIYENVSILTGFPFGRYHYADTLGFKLFLVPIVIAPAYLSAGYLAWTLSAVLLGLYENARSRREVFYQPFVASFLMVMWDLTMDPISSTAQRLWVWHDGGSYFGVPISNFMGWFLCVGTIFFLFSVYVGGGKPANRFGNAGKLTSSYWYQAAVMFALLGSARAILALSGSRETAADATGQIWQVGQIYASMTLVTAFTMWFVAILSALLVSKRQTAPL